MLTTHSVASFNDARKITRIYRARWTIEQVNRTMKTEGFRIETSRVAEGGPFENLAAAVLIAAVRVMQLVGDRDGTAGRPLEDVFDPADRPALEAICATLEGSTARQKNPHKRGSLAYGTWVCARLAGWLDRILWQTWTRGHPARTAAVQGHASGLWARPVDAIETKTMSFERTKKDADKTLMFRDV